MKPVLLLVATFLLFTGCKRAAHDSLKEPINGAFGWALGSRLPAAFEVQTNSGAIRYIDPRGKVPPFEQVVLDLTTDRTIVAITGTLSSVSRDQLPSVQKTLTDSLDQKYIFKQTTADAKATRRQYGDDARQVILAISSEGQTLALCFRDTDLAQQAQREIAALNNPNPGVK